MHWTMTDSPVPGFDGAVRDAGGRVVAVIAAGNALTSVWPDLPPGVGAVVINSGWIDPEDGDAVAAAVRTWGRQGHEAWAARREMLFESARAAGVELWVRPAAGHVLSDVQGTLNEARSWPADAPARVLLDPAALLTPAMLNVAEDHLLRAVDSLADHPRTAALVLTNVELVEGSAGVTLRPCPVHRGLLPIAPLARAAASAGGLPVVLLEEAAREQAAALRGVGDAATVRP